MLLQSFEGLSDREACDWLKVDLRWQAAAGVHARYWSFHPTLLVGMRSRLRSSARPRRLFEDTKVVARATGAMRNRARVLDSTPVFGAGKPARPASDTTPPASLATQVLTTGRHRTQIRRQTAQATPYFSAVLGHAVPTRNRPGTCHART
jgi:Transposase domain (DUF772)